MAALAQGREVGCIIISDVMVEVGASKAHQRPAMPPAVGKRFWCRQIGADTLATPITPLSAEGIVPAPVVKDAHKLSVRTATVFAMPLGTAKPDG